ncbi:MAG: class I SAM-dependent methyltransferase [Halobacteriales archaeon]
MPEKRIHSELSEDYEVIKGVMRTYEKIGSHFSQTRFHPWPEVGKFLEELSGDIALDMGCGNGRHSELLSKCVERVVGVDMSSMMLIETSNRGKNNEFEVNPIRGNVMELPVQTGCADIGVYVATIHHLPTAECRIASLNELERVLVVGGTAIVGSWCTEHERFEEGKGFDTLVNWTLPDGTVVPRYYHIYDIEEFERDVNASRLEVVDIYSNEGNCYAVVSKG